MSVPSQNDDFDLLNTFAHDLKTPLNAARQFVDLIGQMGAISPKQQHYQERAILALDRAVSMINDLLEYAQMGSQGSLNRAECELPRLIEDAVLLLEDTAAQRQIVIRVNVPPNLSTVFADAKFISHVLINLLSNALKYNREAGEVEIMAQNEGAWVKIAVRDTGIGIAPADLPRVFERFYRVIRRGEKRIEGTGLGLAIVKLLIEKHGGEVNVTSEVGVGSVFSFTLPRFDPDRAGVDKRRRSSEARLKSRRMILTNHESASEIDDGLDDDVQEQPSQVSDSDSDSEVL